MPKGDIITLPPHGRFTHGRFTLGVAREDKVIRPIGPAARAKVICFVSGLPAISEEEEQWSLTEGVL